MKKIFIAAIMALMTLSTVTLWADHNGIEHKEPTSVKADVLISQVDCDTAQVEINSNTPVFGAQVFLQVPGAIILDVRDSEPLNDAPMLNQHVVSFINYAAGNFPDGGFPQGQFVFFTFDFDADQPVDVIFRTGSEKYQTMVVNFEDDITGDLVGTQLVPC